MTQKLPTIAVVLAHNEERLIGRCLTSLPLDDPDIEVHVVVNGSRDRTANIARGFAGVVVHEYQEGGKSRSWNRFMLDTPGIEARHYVFIDGDAQILPGSVAARVETLEQTGVNAASGYPANGRRVAQYRAIMTRDHSLFGDLYALHGDFVARFRESGLRLPEDLIGDDGLIGALAKTDLGHEREWSDLRVQPVENAGFLCDPVALSFGGLALQGQRMRAYSQRYFQNQIISDIMRGEGPLGLPAQLSELYPIYLPRFRRRRNPKFWWFDRQALRDMHRLA